MCRDIHNPHKVTPLVIKKLSVAHREEVLMNQQSFQPNSGVITDAIKAIEKGAKLEH